MMHGSDGSHGWPTLGNDRDLTTTGGPRNRVVVCYQALGTGYDSEKGQLGSALATKGMLWSACKANCCYHITNPQVIEHKARVTDANAE